ncbi:MAG: VanZ family protein [Clostridia bacterium]|nr:VanZ family protein [Clostridia bacterium]
MARVLNFLINQIMPGVIPAVVLAIIALIVCLARKAPRAKTVYWTLLAAYAGFVIGETILNPSFVPGEYSSGVNLVPFRDLIYYTRRRLSWYFWQALLNIVLFLPYGVFLKIGRRKLWVSALIGFGSSLLIEAVEYITNRGVFDVDDLILNTLGVVIGYLLAALFFRIRRGKAEQEHI